MSGDSRNMNLPKALLDMKFMKKTKERLEREIQNTVDHDKLYSNIITNEMRNAKDNFVSESSFLFCVDLMEGRLSFKGMNPEIERLMELENPKEDKTGEMQKDISDDDFVKKFSTNNRKRKLDTSSKNPIARKRKI